MRSAMAWLAGMACLTSAAFAGEAASKPQAAAKPNAEGWTVLFDGKNMDAWDIQPDSWEIKDGAMAKTEQGKGYAWSKEQYGDFVLDLEFMNSPKTNSGVFIRTGNTKDPVQTGIEIQVFDDTAPKPAAAPATAKKKGEAKAKPAATPAAAEKKAAPKAEEATKGPDKHSCGAVYDAAAPKTLAVKKPGEWNHMVITCKGSKIQIELNGEPIIDADLDQWTQAGMNPDGTKNKFKTALKDMPRTGFVGLQAHGTPIAYRNIRIKALG